MMKSAAQSVTMAEGCLMVCAWGLVELVKFVVLVCWDF